MEEKIEKEVKLVEEKSCLGPDFELEELQLMYHGLGSIKIELNTDTANKVIGLRKKIELLFNDQKLSQ